MVAESKSIDVGRPSRALSDEVERMTAELEGDRAGEVREPAASAWSEQFVANGAKSKARCPGWSERFLASGTKPKQAGQEWSPRFTASGIKSKQGGGAGWSQRFIASDGKVRARG